MSETFTSYSVDNDKLFRKAIAELSKVCDDLRIPFGLISKDFYRSQQAPFKLKTQGQYPAISEKYGDLKQKKVGFRYPLLVRTGALAASVLGPNNRGSIHQITKLSLVFGSSIKYGIYHQSDAPRTRLPLRKFLFIGPEAKKFATSDQMGRAERWIGYIGDHYAKQIAKAGLGG